MQDKNDEYAPIPYGYIPISESCSNKEIIIGNSKGDLIGQISIAKKWSHLFLLDLEVKKNDVDVTKTLIIPIKELTQQIEEAEAEAAENSSDGTDGEEKLCETVVINENDTKLTEEDEKEEEKKEEEKKDDDKKEGKKKHHKDKHRREPPLVNPNDAIKSPPVNNAPEAPATNDSLPLPQPKILDLITEERGNRRPSICDPVDVNPPRECITPTPEDDKIDNEELEPKDDVSLTTMSVGTLLLSCYTHNSQLIVKGVNSFITLLKEQPNLVDVSHPVYIIIFF